MNMERTAEPVGFESSAQLTELLAGYLLTSPWFRHPGMDGATVEEVVAAEYPAASVVGHVPGPNELIRRHPELTDAIVVFFTV